MSTATNGKPGGNSAREMKICGLSGDTGISVVHQEAKSLDDAIGIAISEAGKRLNPSAKFVEVEAGMLACPFCDQSLSSAIVVADTALVGLVLEMKVFRAESKEHAAGSQNR